MVTSSLHSSPLLKSLPGAASSPLDMWLMKSGVSPSNTTTACFGRYTSVWLPASGRRAWSGSGSCSASHMSGVTTPSGWSNGTFMISFWYAHTAIRVRSPNCPSIGPGWKPMSCSRCCSACTSGPAIPRRNGAGDRRLRRSSSWSAAASSRSWRRSRLAELATDDRRRRPRTVGVGIGPGQHADGTHGAHRADERHGGDDRRQLGAVDPGSTSARRRRAHTSVLAEQRSGVHRDHAASLAAPMAIRNPPTDAPRHSCQDGPTGDRRDGHAHPDEQGGRAAWPTTIWWTSSGTPSTTTASSGPCSARARARR